MQCSYCQAPGAVLKCDACRQRRYCKRDCQKKHWKNGHREECRLHVAEAEAEDEAALVAIAAQGAATAPVIAPADSPRATNAVVVAATAIKPVDAGDAAGEDVGNTDPTDAADGAGDADAADADAGGGDDDQNTCPICQQNSDDDAR